jgi:hypothetical protein
VNYRGYKYLVDKKTKKIYFYGEMYENDMDMEYFINFLDGKNK